MKDLWMSKLMPLTSFIFRDRGNSVAGGERLLEVHAATQHSPPSGNPTSPQHPAAHPSPPADNCLYAPMHPTHLPLRHAARCKHFPVSRMNGCGMFTQHTVVQEGCDWCAKSHTPSLHTLAVPPGIRGDSMNDPTDTCPAISCHASIQACASCQSLLAKRLPTP